jgi:hypothetical protein
VANNITVLPPPGSLECRVFKDRHTDDSQERYKMVYMKAGGSPGIHVASSADGLRWRAYENNPVIVPTGDGLSTPFWDENYQRYVYYHRPAAGHVLRWANVEEPAAYPTRRIGRSEGFEFMSHLWTDLVEVVTPDERDGPGTEFYYMPVIPYQGAYVGMLIIYHEHTGDPDVLAGFNRTLDVQLTFSRDGKKWERVLDRQTFMVGDEDAWDEKRVYPECALVRGDEVWIYYRGSNIPHGTTGGRIADLVDTEIDGKRMIGDALGLATIRLDGFVSIDSAAEPGSMTTWPLRFDGGDELTVNADASGGELLVEALDMFGKPHEGFTRRECQPVAADAVSHRVRWTDGASLKSLVQPVRLRFTMRDTKLYSFQIA